MMNKEQIKTKALPILKRNGVVRAALFGSALRGDTTRESDVDFLVEFEEGKTLLDLVGLQLELEEQLKSKVDVITYDALHPQLRESVLKEQEPIYEAETAVIR